MADLPTIPPYSAMAIESVDMVLSSKANSGARTVRHVGPQGFTMTLSYSEMTFEEFGAIDGFISRMINRALPFFVTMQNRKFQGIETPQTNGWEQWGDSITTNSWGGPARTVAPAGTYFTIGGQTKLYQLAEDLDCDAGGNADMQLTTNTHVNVEPNSLLEFHSPKMNCLAVGKHRFSVAPPEIYSYELDLEEVL